MNSHYQRVIPRDLFNEAKLLKSIGRLVLLILDGKALNGMTYEHDGEPFEVGLLDEGSLNIKNIHFNMADQRLFFKTTYNSKAAYPLYCEWDYVDYLVFDEDGEYAQEFIDFCNSFAEATKKISKTG